jgi:hypothetical protein
LALYSAGCGGPGGDGLTNWPGAAELSLALSPYMLSRIGAETKLHWPTLAGLAAVAPGSISLWMNMFTEVPQVVGCCDQGVPGIMHRIAMYAI